MDSNDQTASAALAPVMTPIQDKVAPKPTLVSNSADSIQASQVVSQDTQNQIQVVQANLQAQNAAQQQLLIMQQLQAQPQVSAPKVIPVAQSIINPPVVNNESQNNTVLQSILDQFSTFQGQLNRLSSAHPSVESTRSPVAAFCGDSSIRLRLGLCC